MRYLVNLCGHDGIVSHYNGVGSMVGRYAEALKMYAQSSGHEFVLNLITPEYNENSFAYSASQYDKSNAIAASLGGKIFLVNNGSNGAVNYGDVEHWRELSKNAASLINELTDDSFDQVINIYNDTPFANLAVYLEESSRTVNVWIPHSTIKIHGEDSAIESGTGESYNTRRLQWEELAIDFINQHLNCYVGMVGLFIEHHLVDEYGLLPDKALKIHNGMFLNTRHEDTPSKTKELASYLGQIKKNKPIIISYGRAENYKNLEYTMRLGAQLRDDFQTFVIAQSYFPTQPILNKYRELARQTGVTLFIDPPFELPKTILGLQQPTIVVVPSHKEIMGLIINEVRAYNNPDLLIAASDIPGLQEQIADGEDGLLIDTALDKIPEVAAKLRANFAPSRRRQIKSAGLIRIAKDYNIVYNFNHFLETILFRQQNTSELSSARKSIRSIPAS